MYAGAIASLLLANQPLL